MYWLEADWLPTCDAFFLGKLFGIFWPVAFMKQFSYDILNRHTKKLILTIKLKIFACAINQLPAFLWSHCSVTWPFNGFDGSVWHKIREFTHFNTMTTGK